VTDKQPNLGIWNSAWRGWHNKSNKRWIHTT